MFGCEWSESPWCRCYDFPIWWVLHPADRKLWVLVKNCAWRTPSLANNKLHHDKHSREVTGKRNSGLTVSKGQWHRQEHHQQRHEGNNWNSCCGNWHSKPDDTCWVDTKQTELSHIWLLWPFLLKKKPLTIFCKASLVVMNSLRFCLSEELFISPILNENLVK